MAPKLQRPYLPAPKVIEPGLEGSFFCVQMVDGPWKFRQPPGMMCILWKGGGRAKRPDDVEEGQRDAWGLG